MSSGLSYRKDVEFLAECNPALVERNALEFKRLRDLLTEIGTPARRAETGTEWHSENSGAYTARLSEARKLAEQMAEGFGKAASALHAYSQALTTARSHYSAGKRTEQQLADLIHTKGTAITRTAQEAEPMRQWEDMRATTGFLDGLAELTMDVDDIRDRANSLHDSCGGSFHQAKSAESEARATCLHALNQAYDLLPEFRLKGDSSKVDLYAAMADMRREGEEARQNPLTHLPGSGPKRDLADGPLGKEPVSPALREIQMKVAGLPGDAANGYWNPPDGDDEKAAWLSKNKEVLKAAAAHAGLPVEVVAGIAWQEISGQPQAFDDITDTLRQQADAPWGLSPITAENLPWRLGGKADETSFGPIAIQVRRGAEVLGYDPANLTDGQRNLIEDALQDPKQNAFIAAGYLAQLKAESGFANVPPEQMTDAQMRELAARYNGGPYYETTKAQQYGERFGDSIGKVKEALR
ncbi:hypothetical protein [Streptomyces bambusae]|uniref:Transglycosylase SLT domain-containing protein n=1 Tax=Streptomyces bambusae TaxID=1550616 RepID=A0ABS6Z1V8_9ACTN|nr:hypothetical protein [Streptomyces bambusae]MBW5481233.1 hypothetical protein [Streptomyces bambusae]